MLREGGKTMRKLGKKRQTSNETVQAYASCFCMVCACKSCASASANAMLDSGANSQNYGTIMIVAGGN